MNLLSCFFEENKKDKSKMKLFKLQSCIVDILNKYNYAMIFDEVGCGKSITTIHAILDVLSKKKKGELVNILIIAPNEDLAKKWKFEIEKFIGIKFSIVHNKGECKYSYDDEKSNLFITYNSSNYQNLGIDRLSNTLYKEFNFEELTYDELKKLEGGIYINSYDSILYNILSNYSYKEIYSEAQRLGINITENQIKDFLTKYHYINDNNKLINKKNYKQKCYKTSKWDLMIIDEAHAIYENYYKKLFGKKASVGKIYYKVEAIHKAEKLLLLTATPKNIEKLIDVVDKVLINNKNIIRNINSKEFINVKALLPYRKYYKEMIIGNHYKRNRGIEFIEYDVSDLMKKINQTSIKCDNYYRNQENMALMIKSISNIEHMVIDYTEEEKKLIYKAKEIYNKKSILEADIESLKDIDNKLIQFVKYIKESKNFSGIVFVQNTNTRDLIKNISQALHIKTFVLEDKSKTDIERLSIIENFNKYDGEKVLITTWQIGNFGLNVYGADTVICYETPYGINEVEQGFGRIDRMDFGFDEIKLIFFMNKDRKYHFDSIGVNRLYNKLFQYQSKVPSKNILFTSEYLKEYLKSIDDSVAFYLKIEEMLFNIEEYLKNKNIEKVEFIDKEKFELLLKKYNVEYENYYNEIGLYNDEIYLNNIRKLVNDKKKLQEDISYFIDKSKEVLDEVDIINNLKNGIFYREEGELRVISINELKKNIDCFESNHFNKILQSYDELENVYYEDIKAYAENNYCEVYSNAINNILK